MTGTMMTKRIHAGSPVRGAMYQGFISVALISYMGVHDDQVGQGMGYPAIPPIMVESGYQLRLSAPPEVHYRGNLLVVDEVCGRMEIHLRHTQHMLLGLIMNGKGAVKSRVIGSPSP